MAAAKRTTPTVLNGGSDDGEDYTNLVNDVVTALWSFASTPLTNIGGTANAITATSDTTRVEAVTAYTQGMRFLLEYAFDNTSAVTINIDGVGVADLKDAAGDPLVGGELAAGTLGEIVRDAGEFRVVGVTAGAGSVSVSSAPDIIVQDQKASGTAGGTFTSGADRIRTLNTSVRNVVTGASVTSNQLTLPAGTYYVEFDAIAAGCNAHKAKLWNATDGSVVTNGHGSTEGAVTAGLNTHSRGGVVFTITSAKAFEVRHRCQTTRATNGFGTESSFGDIEIYTDLRVWKQ